MSLRLRLTRAYFDSVYNRLYDATTAQLVRYKETQELLAERLSAVERQKVLCVGLGTGNELTHLRQRAPDLEITGIDFSPQALRHAGQKPAGQQTSLALMDAKLLAFRDESFDRVLCYHVTDFLLDPSQAVAELMRVLRPEGRFVISFPASSDGLGLGTGLLSHGVGSGCSDARHCGALKRGLTAILTGIVYLPLLLRPRPATFTESQVRTLLRTLGTDGCTVEHDPIYRDHLASGIKMEGVS
ncbi:MAG: class I SAM-dependent methyltransferase [Dehalococcoidia bacterium]|nr:class I SAM-dependent methyltransferase [Dehalococcoidia bacterium]